MWIKLKWVGPEVYWTLFCAAAVYCSWAHWNWYAYPAMVSILPPMVVSSGKFCHGQILFGTWISWWWLPVAQHGWSSCSMCDSDPQTSISVTDMWGHSYLKPPQCLVVIAIWTYLSVTSHWLRSQRILSRVVVMHVGMTYQHDSRQR
jgi:hypothetical protein